MVVTSLEVIASFSVDFFEFFFLVVTDFDFDEAAEATTLVDLPETLGFRVTSVLRPPTGNINLRFSGGCGMSVVIVERERCSSSLVDERSRVCRKIECGDEDIPVDTSNNKRPCYTSLTV